LREVDYTRVTKDYKDYNYITIRLDTNITTKYKGTKIISKSYTKVTLNIRCNRYKDTNTNWIVCLCMKWKMLKWETFINTSSLTFSTIGCLPKGCTNLWWLLSMANKITQSPTRKCLQRIDNLLKDQTKDTSTPLNINLNA